MAITPRQPGDKVQSASVNNPTARVMDGAVYDPAGHKQDVFGYVDRKIDELEEAVPGMAPVQSVDGRTGDVNTFFKAGGSASTYPSTYGRFAVTANIFSNIQVDHYYGLLTIEAIGNYQRHMFESSWGEVWVGWRESATVAEPTVWNKVAGGIGNSVRQVFASTDSAGWYRLAVMNDQITSAVIHLHATGWWEEDLYILIGRNYVSSANPPSITIFGNTYNTRATQFRLNEISSSETYLEAYITPTNAHQLTITPFLTGWNRAYAVPKALSSSTGTIYATISHTAGDTIETSGKIAGALRPTSVAYANIDSIAETGFYKVTGTPGLLVHEQWDANYATQIWHQYTTTPEAIKYRIKRDGAWGSWFTIPKGNGGLYRSENNVATATFSGLDNISNTSIYKHGLLFGSPGTDTPFLYYVFVNTNGAVVLTPIFTRSSLTFTGSVSNGVLTITASGTVWGGMKLIWLG